MSKRKVTNKSSSPEAKEFGRSHGNMVRDELLGDMVTPKILSARKKNNPKKYI